MTYNNYYKVIKGFSYNENFPCNPGWNELACEYIDVKPGSEMPPIPIHEVDIKQLIENDKSYFGAGPASRAKSIGFYSNDPDRIVSVLKNKCLCFSHLTKRGGHSCKVLGCHCQMRIHPDTRCLSYADIERYKNFQVCGAGATVFRKNNAAVKYSPGCMCRQCYDIQSIVEVGDPISAYGNGGTFVRLPNRRSVYKITSRKGTNASVRLTNAKETAVKVITGKYYDKKSRYESFEFEEQIDSSSKIQADYELTQTITYNDLMKLFGEDTNINPLIGARDNWEGEMAEITLGEAANIVALHVKNTPLPDGWTATKIANETELENVSEGKKITVWRHPVTGGLGGVTIQYVKTPVTFNADELFYLVVPEKISKKYPNMIMKTLAGFKNITHV